MVDRTILDLDQGDGKVFETVDASGASKRTKRSLLPGIKPPTGLHASEHAVDSFVQVSAIAEQLIFYPMTAQKTLAITKLLVNATGITAVMNARLGLYNSNPATRQPGTLLLDGGVVALDLNNGMKSTPTFGAVTLEEGERYWLAAIFDGTTASFSCYGNAEVPPIFGFDAAGVKQTKLHRTTTYGALPADESTQSYTFGTNTFNPVVFLS